MAKGFFECIRKSMVAEVFRLQPLFGCFASCLATSRNERGVPRFDNFYGVGGIFILVCLFRVLDTLLKLNCCCSAGFPL